MTTKILSGVYSSGYTLAANYSGVSVTRTGSVTGVNYSTGTTYKPGGDGLTLVDVATLGNSGQIQGGKGSQGRADSYSAYYSNGQYYIGYITPASQGYAGGAGVVAHADVQIVNHSTIRGGEGGFGGVGGVPFFLGGGGIYSAKGGDGGAGIILQSGGQINNSGLIQGGDGYYGGIGGAGIELAAGGVVANSGGIEGGAGSSGGYGNTAPPSSGVGISLLAGGKVTNGSSAASSAYISGSTGVVVNGTGTVANWGTIKGLSGPSVQFNSTKDVLIAEAGSEFIGQVVGGGGTLDLAGGVGTIAGLGGTATLTGALSATISGFGAYDIATGAHWSLAGASSLANTGALVIAGSLINEGTMDQNGLVTLANGAVDNQSGAVWDLANGIDVAAGESGTFTNAGTLVRETSATSVNNIHADLINTGTLEVAGGTLSLDGPVNFLSGLVTGPGTLQFGGGVTRLDTGLALSVGALATKGATTKVIVNETLAWSNAWVQSGGTLAIASGDILTLSGTGDSFAGTIDGAGTVDFAGGSDLLKTLSLSSSHIVFGAANVTLDNVIIGGQVGNSGTITLQAGTLTVNGMVSGAGTLAIVAGKADFNSAFSEDVSFTGASGELELARSISYHGTISGFSKTGGTSLDLLDIAFGGATKAIYSGTATGGLLTVTDGVHTAKIKLAGDYTGSIWKVASDGHGGVTVVDPTPVHGLASAISAFSSSATASVTPPPQPSFAQSGFLTTASWR
ncbi:MAG TPA: hypothetical protein VGH15_01970 [Caulobacteraceae bacterium]